jgi:hypothetical protein
MHVRKHYPYEHLWNDWAGDHEIHEVTTGAILHDQASRLSHGYWVDTHGYMSWYSKARRVSYNYRWAFIQIET